MKDQSKSFRCMKCNSILTVSARKAKTLDGAQCGACGGPLLEIKNTPIRELTVSINVDCSDAIKGLKAVQRAARKATVDLTGLRNAMADATRNSALDVGMSICDVKMATKVMNGHEHR